MTNKRFETHEMDPERKSTHKERKMTDDTTHPNPVVERLKRLLLEAGGEVALVHEQDTDLEKIIDRGTLVDGEGAGMRSGNAGRCHENAGDGFTRFADLIATGYALSVDGFWSLHSWNVNPKSGAIIETTEPRIAYFGFVLDEDEAETFADENPVTPVDVDFDSDALDLMILIRSSETEFEFRDESALRLRSRWLIDPLVLGESVWFVEFDESSDEYHFLGWGFVDDFESDDEAEIQTVLSCSEFMPVDPPIGITDRVAVDFLKRSNTREILFDLTGNRPMVEYFLSLQKTVWDKIETELV